MPLFHVDPRSAGGVEPAQGRSGEGGRMDRVPSSYYLGNSQLKMSVRFLRANRTERGDLFDHAAWQLNELRKNAVKNGTLPIGKVARKPTPEQLEERRRIMMWFARGKPQRPPASSAKDDAE